MAPPGCANCSIRAALPGLPSFGEFCNFIALPEVRAAQQRYAATDPLPQPPG